MPTRREPLRHAARCRRTHDGAQPLNGTPAPAFEGDVVIDWQLSSYFAWGLLGIHFMTNWALQGRGRLLTSIPVRAAAVEIGPLEWTLIRPALEASRALQARLAPLRGQQVSLNVPVLQSLGNDFADQGGPLGVRLAGTPSVALPAFEDTDLRGDRLARIRAYPLVVAASNWNRTLLEAAGVERVELALQGVDPTAFHPAPRAGVFAGRFAIFSGGKPEYRKGQDLVLRAFAAFARRRPDAVLATAWASPWPKVAESFACDSAIPPVPFTSEGRLDVVAWAAAYGIASDRVIDLGAQPNGALPRLYREMDVGLFPNRCEGGTNLVAMELMACGVPVILAANTGHLDLIAPDRCYALASQTPIPGAGRTGWGQSDVEEIVETLDAVYADRPASHERGARGAAFMAGRTWAAMVRRLREILASAS